MKIKKSLGFVFLIAVFMFSIAHVTAQSSSSGTVCCELTNSGNSCQNVQASECVTDGVPTSCETTSFCSSGWCFDSQEGSCKDNVPQSVCNAEGGTWTAEQPAQCQLGCCVLGNQASFVTRTACKAQSANLGITTNYRTDILDEVSCIQSVQQQDTGACVFESDFEIICRTTTRAECNDGIGEQATVGEFFVNTLCSDEELGTNCGPTTQTTCVPGKDEVYFVDSCGNPANIYDASKINDDRYWSEVFSKVDSCGFGDSNANSATCGSCNYLQGSFCRGVEQSLGSATPNHGNNICADLNCVDFEGNDRLHGESWCAFEDAGTTGQGSNTVGSRFHRQICNNGEVIVEACSDFRQETCIQDSIETSAGEFSQAACRVNRWQDCTVQTDRQDCENTDRRDCIWKGNPGTDDDERYYLSFVNETQEGVCIAKDTVGLNFWDSAETQQICGQGNAQCIVTFEQGIFGKEQCVNNCYCLKDGWEKQHIAFCASLGDCGPATNWNGQAGFDDGYEIEVKKI